MDFDPSQAPLIVSLHDIAPSTEAATREWCRILDRWGIRRRSLAVIPFSSGVPLRSCASLVDFLRAEIAGGSEIVQHGYTHQHPSPYTVWHHRLYDRFIARGNAEFFRPGPDVSVGPTIGAGRAELEESLGVTIRGFTAPCWAQDCGVDAQLRLQEFGWYDTMGGIIDLVRRRRIRAPVITGTPPDSMLGSLIMPVYGFYMIPLFFRRSVRRVALHPYDLANSRFMRYSEKFLRTWAARRRLAVYAEVVR